MITEHQFVGDYDDNNNIGDDNDDNIDDDNDDNIDDNNK